MHSMLDAWRQRGRTVNVAGLDVFVVEAGPAESTRLPLVLLHGFPTSGHDFEPVLEQLAETRRVVVLDYPGFGLSAKPTDYSYSLFEQADIAASVWRECGIERAHLVAHDYGTSVATELLARRQLDLLPLSFASVTLCNGSAHIELAKLRVTQQLLRSTWAGPWVARLAGERFFMARMRKIFGRPDAVSEARLHSMWAGIEHAEGNLRLPAISQYLDERFRFWTRWIGALRRLDLPTHVLWGQRDPVAVPAIAEALHADVKGSKLTWLETLGHYPMLEDPNQWASAVLGFVEQHDDSPE